MANTDKPEQQEELAKASQVYNQPTLDAFPKTIAEGGIVVLRATPENGTSYQFNVDDGVVTVPDERRPFEAHWDTKGLRSSSYEATVTVTFDGNTRDVGTRITVLSRQVQAAVTLQRSAAGQTSDQALWVAIRNRTDAISFDRYNEFVNRLLCLGVDETATCPQGSGQQAKGYGATTIGDIRTNLDQRPNIYGPDAYYLLKLAAQAFLIFESGIVIDRRRNPVTGDPTVEPVPGLEDSESRLGRPVNLGNIQEELRAYLEIAASGRVLPYLNRIVNALIPAADSRDERLPYCGEILQHRFSCPSLLELIWSYWEEEGPPQENLWVNLGSGKAPSV